MGVYKPILTVDEQIAHLKQKGVQFDLCEEEQAKEYLRRHNNYFKLTAYRKNYPKHPEGPKKGTYVGLDFAFLVDLAVIDMVLRYQIVRLSLDLEHHVKLRLLRKVEENDEDGYSVVKDYFESLGEKQQEVLKKEIDRNRGSIYCGDIVSKYDPSYPVWAFLEIIPFGRVIAFYEFCARRFSDAQMEEDFYRLQTCKEIRNAAAHSNCIINDLHARTVRHDTNAAVTQELMRISGMKSGFRRNRMSNARIQQIVTLLYMHKTVVESEGIHKAETEELHKVVNRFFKHSEYYENNEMIKSTFAFLKKVIDTWFQNI